MNKKLLAYTVLCNFLYAEIDKNSNNIFLSSDNVAYENITRQLVVEATKMERTLEELPMTVNLITREDIEKSGVQSVAELLQDIPGIQLMEAGSTGMYSIKIRGEAATGTLILIDGIKQKDQSLGAVNTGVPIFISPSEIERIEVIKGPASVVYGDGAIGGVINIITKKGGDKPFNLTQALNYNSSNKGFSSYTSLYGSVDGFFYNFGADFTNNENRKTPKGEMYGTKADKKHYDGKVGYVWEDGEFFLGTSRVKDEYKYCSDNEKCLFDGIGESEYHYKKDAYNTSLTLKNITDSFVKFKISGDYQKLEKQTEKGGEKRNTKSFGGELQNDFILGDHYLTLGAEHHQDKYSAFAGNDGRIRNDAIYLQDEWQVFDDFALILGGRQANYKAKSSKINGDKNLNKFLPSLGFAYNGIENLSFRANYSQGYKVPSLYQLVVGSSGGHVTMPVLPNPDLKAQTSDNYDLGLIANLGNATINTALFYSKTKNYISSYFDWANYTMSFKNVNKAKTWGAELGTSLTLSSFLPYANLTWMQRELDYGTYKSKKSGTAPFYGRAGLKWNDKVKDFSLFADANINWESKSKLLQNNEEKIYHSWATYNAQLGIEKGNMLFTFDLKNIGNKTYMKADSSRIYEPKRHFVISGRYTIN